MTESLGVVFVALADCELLRQVILFSVRVLGMIGLVLLSRLYKLYSTCDVVYYVYVCMVITYCRVWINRVRSPIVRQNREYCTAGRPGSSEVPRNPLTRWDVSSIPAKGIFLTKKIKNKNKNAQRVEND